MDDTNRLLRERLRRLVEENIRLEQRLIQLGEAESSRLRDSGAGSSLLAQQHLFDLDSDRSRSGNVLSQLELLRRSDPIYDSRNLHGDISLATLERQRQELLLRELTAAGRVVGPTNRFELSDDIRHQQSLEEGLQRALERSTRLEEIQRGSSSALPQRLAARESLFHGLVPAANEQALLRNLPYASAASMPMEDSCERSQSSLSAKALSKPLSTSSTTEEGTVLVALDADADFLTKYQVVLRQCLEFFTAQSKDVETSVQGRKHKVQVGQIGLRCRFCCHLPIYQRGRGSVHFVKNIRKIYQAAQNMSTTHFITSCSCIPKDLRARLAALRGIREMGKVGNVYWVDSCKDLGIVEHNGALWWQKDEGKLWSKEDVTASSAAIAATASSDGSDKEDELSDDDEEVEGKTVGEEQGKPSG